MLRLMKSLVLAAALAGVTATAVFAGSPHYVSADASRVGNSVVVNFKEAGLGNELQIISTVTGTAECINGGSNHPKAANKENLFSTTTTPVQNGKAEDTITLTSTLTCSPPMTIRFVDVVLTDTTNHISVRFGDF